MPRQNHRANKHKASVITRDGRACHYCGKPSLTGRDASLDHLVPLVAGGKDSLDNLVLCCLRCNAMKQSSTLEDYIARRLLQLLREKNRLMALAHKHDLI